MDARTYADRLRTRRESQGATQRFLADAALVSVRSIQGYEAGRVVPPVDVARRMADALDTSLDELFGPAEQAA